MAIITCQRKLLDCIGMYWTCTRSWNECRFGYMVQTCTKWIQYVQVCSMISPVIWLMGTVGHHSMESESPLVEILWKRHRKLEKIPWNSGQTSWKWQCLPSSGRVQKFHTVKWTLVHLQDFKRNIHPPSSKQTIANLSPTPPFAGAATGAEEAWLWSAIRKEASPSWSTNERNCLTFVTSFWHPQSAQSNL